MCRRFFEKNLFSLMAHVSQLHVTWEKPKRTKIRKKVGQKRNSHHLISSSDENGHSSGVLALLDDQHFVLSCPERDLLHEPGKAQLLGRELREPRHDAPSGRDGYQLGAGAGGGAR